jgi:hypothetical protein
LILGAVRCEIIFALRRAVRTRTATFLIEVSVSRSPLAASFPDRRTLTPRDRRVLRSVAEAMFSQDGEVERERLDTHLDQVDAFISAASKPLRAGLRIALFIVQIAPLLFFYRMRLIEGLSVDERVEVLARLERSRLANLSLAFIGWRTVMTLVFYEHPAELRSMGYASEERRVYKRRLPALLVAAPAPEESGVRLRGDAEAVDSENRPAVAAENKVA